MVKGDKKKGKNDTPQNSELDSSTTIISDSTQTTNVTESTQMQNSDIKLLISRFDGLSDQIQTVSNDLQQIKDDVSSLTKLQA